jgi:hypothetical protein
LLLDVPAADVDAGTADVDAEACWELIEVAGVWVDEEEEEGKEKGRKGMMWRCFVGLATRTPVTP